MFLPFATHTKSPENPRNNAWGNNVNRVIFDNSTDPEARGIMEFIKKFGPFYTTIAGHEDDRNYPPYVYHMGERDPFFKRRRFRKDMKAKGHDLFSGEDEDDPVLHYMFDRGYNYTRKIKDDGTLEPWIVNHGHTSRIYTVEIPMDSPFHVKKSMYEIFLNHLVLNNPNLRKKL